MITPDTVQLPSPLRYHHLFIWWFWWCHYPLLQPSCPVSFCLSSSWLAKMCLYLLVSPSRTLCPLAFSRRCYCLTPLLVKLGLHYRYNPLPRCRGSRMGHSHSPWCTMSSFHMDTLPLVMAYGRQRPISPILIVGSLLSFLPYEAFISQCISQHCSPWLMIISAGVCVILPIPIGFMLISCFGLGYLLACPRRHYVRYVTFHMLH